MDLREIGWEVMDWTHLLRDTDQWWALANTWTFGINKGREI